MADLRKFIAPDARTGQKLGIYVARIQVGEGTFQTVEPLRVVVHGKGKFFGKEISGSVEVIMPDTTPDGECTLVLNGVRHEKCPYQTSGQALLIHGAGEEIRIQDHDRSYTWIQARGIWAGLWPANVEMRDEYLADAPAGSAEPAAVA